MHLRLVQAAAIQQVPLIASMAEPDVQLIVRNPSGDTSKDVSLHVPPDLPLRELRLRIQGLHPSKPAPETQTLIHAGKVLRDETVPVGTVLRQVS